MHNACSKNIDLVDGFLPDRLEALDIEISRDLEDIVSNICSRLPDGKSKKALLKKTAGVGILNHITFNLTLVNDLIQNRINVIRFQQSEFFQLGLHFFFKHAAD